MSFIEIFEEKRINQNDSAFPTIAKLDNGDLICGFSVGGGPEVTGGSDWVEFNLKKTLRTLVQASIKAGRKRITLAYSKISLTSYVDYVKQVWNEILKEYSRECSGTLLYFSGADDQKNSSECAKKFTDFQADSLMLMGISPTSIESKLAPLGYQVNKDYLLSSIGNKTEVDCDKFSYAIAPYKTLADET